MLTENTMKKLHEMRLTVMAKALREQLQDPSFNDMPFEDRVSLLVDREWCARKNNQLARLKKTARFADPSACVENIEYHADRCLDKTMIVRLATCAYINEAHNVILMGATGTGKTYLACAFGMEACKQYYKTYFIRLPDLLIALREARENGTYLKVLAKYANVTLLIIDEWLMLKPTEAEQKDIFELIHRRRKKSSTIFCSQVHWDGWYEQLGGDASPLADAILDRIIYDAYRIHIQSIDSKNDKSMREVYGLDKRLRE